jgi:hypothetical protein
MTLPTIVECPHCGEETPLGSPCRHCRGGVRMEDFRLRMAQICQMERWFNLPDLRPEVRK